MTDIVIGTKQIQIKIRLHIRCQMFRSLAVDFIFICINYIYPVIFADLPCHFIQRVWFQGIIMIQKPHKIPRRHLHSCIGILCDTFIFFQDLIANSGIFQLVLPDHRSQLRISIRNLHHSISCFSALYLLQILTKLFASWTGICQT